MIELTVEPGGYLAADADEWLEEVADHLQEFSQTLQEYCTPDRDGESGMHESLRTFNGRIHATDANVITALEGLGLQAVSYGPLHEGDGRLSIAMCNMETLLDHDLSFLAVDVVDKNDVLGLGHEDAGDYPVTLLITTGEGYWQGYLDSVDVYLVKGETMGLYEALLSFAYGHIGHVGDSDDCTAEWVVEGSSYIYDQNEGFGTRMSVEEIVEDGKLVCPVCGKELAAMITVS